MTDVKEAISTVPSIPTETKTVNDTKNKEVPVSQNGKGDMPRPTNLNSYRENYDNIFRKKNI